MALQFSSLTSRLCKIVIVLTFLCGACSSRSISPNLDDMIKLTPSQGIQESEVTGCKSMLDSYCDLLYSPTNNGNLSIKKSNGSFSILQGETNNDFSMVYFEYAKAKLKNQDSFPTDFRDTLNSRNYFQKLQLFLLRKSKEKMTFFERTQSIRQGHDLDSIWASAIEETILKRLEKKYEGFHKLREDYIPLELALERKRIRRILISEISQSIWKSHPNWKRVQENFETLRIHFISVISKLAIPQEIQNAWIQRVLSVNLALPGALAEISDNECSSTVINAYYYPHLNILTVCAGDFNSEDILETIAHELGHALDLDRSRYIFQINSLFGKELANLRNQICSKETFSCAHWSQFKNDFQRNLTELRKYIPELPQFQQCLKYKSTPNRLTESDIYRLATSIVNNKIASLADTGTFLRVTKSNIPLSNGRIQANPYYLNPCSYYLSSHGNEPIDDELTSLIFFTAEYQCNNSEEIEKFKLAIELAKTMSTAVESAVIRMEGEFSGKEELQSGGYAASPSERFADVIGSYAFADLLNSTPSVSDRRKIFLASSSWQCSKPSLATRFPAENAIQSLFSLDNHADPSQRKMEFFSAPVRDSLNCSRDFSFSSCELQFQK